MEKRLTGSQTSGSVRQQLLKSSSRWVTLKRLIARIDLLGKESSSPTFLFPNSGRHKTRIRYINPQSSNAPRNLMYIDLVVNFSSLNFVHFQLWRKLVGEGEAFQMCDCTCWTNIIAQNLQNWTVPTTRLKVIAFNQWYITAVTNTKTCEIDHELMQYKWHSFGTVHQF